MAKIGGIEAKKPGGKVCLVIGETGTASVESRSDLAALRHGRCRVLTKEKAHRPLGLRLQEDRQVRGKPALLLNRKGYCSEQC